MTFSLIAPTFVALALLAVVSLTVLPGAARQIFFLALNLAFLGVLLLGPRSSGVLLAFCLAGYGLVLLMRRYPRGGLTLAVAGYVVAFIYLRNYDFLGWVLPDQALVRAVSTIGLSFLFFKVIHVMVDAWSGTLERVDFLTFLNYCLGFHTFTMGPIQRYQDYAAQWEGRQDAIAPTFEAHLDAVTRIARGLVKAYVLAPLFELWAFQPNTDLLSLTMGDWMIHAYAFYFFLYLNFAGYCDVVIGLGSLMGVRPPENFNLPFIARNISDFWLRQHRSLTLWLTDYVFSPLYKKTLKTGWLSVHPLLAVNAALMATMLVSGLWHGTTVGFLLFGAVHGLWFVIYRSWDTLLLRAMGRKRVKAFRQRFTPRVVGTFLTFNATAFAFVFFEVDSEHLLRALAALGAA